MDIWNCSGKKTRLDSALYYVAMGGMTFCVAIGLPFACLVALGVVQ